MSNKLEKSIPPEILRAFDSIPSISPLVRKLNRASSKTEIVELDIIEVVRSDPALMSRVMKLVNSAFYSVSERVCSLEQAIGMLGVVTVKNLALTASTMEAMKFPAESISISSDELWEHCLYVAVACKVLGQACDVNGFNDELFFLTGLLHDIGKLAFIKAAPLRYDCALCESKNLQITLRFAEQCHFGCAHDTVGSVMAEKWRLDKKMTAAIAGHHLREVATGDIATADLTKILIIANNLCKAEQLGFSGDTAVEEWHVPMLAGYGRFESDIRDYAGRIKLEAESLKKAFSSFFARNAG